jgi:hypothetical protein
MQADLKSYESAATSLHLKIIHLEQELVTRKEGIKSLTDDLINSNKKYEELSRLLDETQQEVCDTHVIIYYCAQDFTVVSWAPIMYIRIQNKHLGAYPGSSVSNFYTSKERLLMSKMR